MLNGDLGGLYEYYHIMKYYGNYSTTDVDNMYPFERDIFFSMLLETKNKEKQNS